MDADQIAVFRRDGSLLLRSYFTPSEVADITRWIEELVEGLEEVGRHWVYREATAFYSTRKSGSSSALRIFARSMTVLIGWEGSPEKT